MAVTLEQLQQIANNTGTQFNYKLPDGNLILAGRNPSQAATVDLRGLFSGQTASPIPIQLLNASQEYSTQINKPLDGTPIANSELVQSRSGTPDESNPLNVDPFANKTSPTSSETYTLPSGAVVDGHGTLISGPTNTSAGAPNQVTTSLNNGISTNPTPQPLAIGGSTSALQSNTTKQPPNVALQPGATGEAVKQLQDYLVSQGLMTQDQVNTGYGTYGPQTTAAVKALQEKYGVDNSTGVGYFGPKTIAAISTSATPTNTTSTSSTTQTSNTNPTSSTTDPNAYNPNYGVTQDQWNQMNATQRATVAAINDIKKQAYQTDGQQLTFADALKNAATDPNIIAKYSDAAKIDANTFGQNLQQIQQAATTTGQQQQMQFEADRKALADQQAAKGAAYSGFRGKAQEQLGQTESGIVQSSRADLAQKLNTATSAFETKYGTSATNPASANFLNPDTSSNYSLSGLYTPANKATETLTGSLAGGITGTQPIAQQNDINTKATSLYNLANFTPQLA